MVTFAGGLVILDPHDHAQSLGLLQKPGEQLPPLLRENRRVSRVQTDVRAVYVTDDGSANPLSAELLELPAQALAAQLLTIPEMKRDGCEVAGRLLK